MRGWNERRNFARNWGAVILRSTVRVETLEFPMLPRQALPTMILINLRLLSLLLAAFQLRSNLAHENLALRQQRAIMKRRQPRPRPRRSDRVYWLLLSRAWSHPRETSDIVNPETAIRQQQSD